MKAPVLFLAAIAIAGCSDQNVNLGGNYRVAAFVPPIANKSIDLLFVVDSSQSMADNQAQLAAHAQNALFDVISAAIGEMPDLHVGVITPDLDLGIAIGDPTCDDGGDGGTLHVGACGLTDRYLVDVDDGAGGRITNYTGTLADAFGCIANVGANGCGFEQPLAAVQAALLNPANDGFLRDDALLVVVMLTDEDDCSALPALFDPANGQPLRSYRCFHEGVVCNEDLDSVGVKTDCTSVDAHPYVLPLVNYETVLVDAKNGDPSKVMVAAITGPVEPVEVGMSPLPEPALELVPSCVDTSDPSLPSGWAYPAIRLHDFLEHFPGRSWSDSICAAVDPSAALTRTANSIGDLAGARPCLRGDLKDVDAEAAGVQPSCRVFLATAAYTPSESRRELGACEGDGTDCFRITTDAAACGHWSGLAVELVGAEQATTEDLIAECIVP